MGWIIRHPRAWRKSATTTSGATTTTSGAPVIDCNSCDPPIKDTLRVAFGDCDSDWDFYDNKTYDLEWVSGCLWEKGIDSDHKLQIAYGVFTYWGLTAWKDTFTVSRAEQQSGDYPCEPDGHDYDNFSPQKLIFTVSQV